MRDGEVTWNTQTENQSSEIRGGGTTTSGVNLEELANIMQADLGKNGSVYRTAQLLGFLTKENHTIKANIPSQDRSQFSQERYKFFLEAPFEISSECCKVMKKKPVHEYTRKTGRKFMTAQMASESRLRTQQWIKNGCNGFDMKNPISNPMAFWVEQDVLLYIQLYLITPLKKAWEDVENSHGSKRRKARKYLKKVNYRKLAIASVYGDIVNDYSSMKQVKNQMSLADFGIFDNERPLLKTTGCSRTGCMFCGYGCHLEKSPNRFERMKETHPKLYEYIMKDWEKGGLGYKKVIDWINEHGNLDIKY